MVYIPEWNNASRYEILRTLNLGCSFTTLRTPCNDQRPRCCKSFTTRFPSQPVQQSHTSHRVRLFNTFNSENHGINITKSATLNVWLYAILFHSQILKTTTIARTSAGKTAASATTTRITSSATTATSTTTGVIGITTGCSTVHS